MSKTGRAANVKRAKIQRSRMIGEQQEWARRFDQMLRDALPLRTPGPYLTDEYLVAEPAYLDAVKALRSYGDVAFRVVPPCELETVPLSSEHRGPVVAVVTWLDRKYRLTPRLN